MSVNELLMQCSYFGFFLAIFAYYIGTKIQKKFPYTICNPLLFALILVMVFLTFFKIEYETFNNGAKYITYLLTPTTVCLAVPLYKQIKILKDNLVIILISIIAGCVAAALTIWGLCLLFRLDAVTYHSLQPKSITTAIALPLSEEIGGNYSLTNLAVIMTGIFGAVVAKLVCKIFRITHPVAIGLACGTSAHAIGTSKALEIGEVEGAMSSLAVVVAGLLTVILVPILSNLLIIA